MSTLVSATSATVEPGCGFNFQQLADHLTALPQAPTLAEVQGWVAQAAITAEDVCAYRRFREGTYARNHVLKTELLEVLILCWEPQQCTVIHDHNGSFGVVRVLEGQLSETLYEQDAEGILRRTREAKWTAGAVTGADVPDIHCLYNCQHSGQRLVTLHVYCPPLHKLNTYKENSAEITQIISGETSKTCEDA